MYYFAEQLGKWKIASCKDVTKETVFVTYQKTKCLIRSIFAIYAGIVACEWDVISGVHPVPFSMESRDLFL